MNYESVNFTQQDHQNIADLFDYSNLNKEEEQKAQDNFKKLLESNDAPRYLYIIRCCPFIYYEIGITNNIEKRIKTLQIGCPFDLKFIVAVEADMEDFLGREIAYLEKFLHENYKHLNFKGEWFELSEKHISDICCFLENNRDFDILHEEAKELRTYFEIIDKIIAEEVEYCNK